MKEERILDGIRQAVRELEVPYPVELDTHVLNDMELDSLQLIALVVEIENRFRVCLEPEDEARIATIGDLVEVIRRRLPEDSHG
jgi:acyl carrier protein